MGDLRIVWDATTASGDLVLNGPSLETGNDLETAVLVSLFTDQVADDADLMPAGQAADPRGWWADTYTADPIGSKLWQGFWRQAGQETLNWASDQARKALQWMIDDGVAASIDVTAQAIGKGGLGLGIVITEPSGGRTPFSYAWNQEG